jgi:multisubunit Na+/H+ antiporter MnhG subunit
LIIGGLVTALVDIGLHHMPDQQRFTASEVLVCIALWPIVVGMIIHNIFKS